MQADTALSQAVRDRMLPGLAPDRRGQPADHARTSMPPASPTTCSRAVTDAVTVGPILIGPPLPAHIVNQSVTARGIVNMSAVACVQAASARRPTAEAAGGRAGPRRAGRARRGPRTARSTRPSRQDERAARRGARRPAARRPTSRPDRAARAAADAPALVRALGPQLDPETLSLSRRRRPRRACWRRSGPKAAGAARRPARDRRRGRGPGRARARAEQRAILADLPAARARRHRAGPGLPGVERRPPDAARGGGGARVLDGRARPSTSCGAQPEPARRLLRHLPGRPALRARSAPCRSATSCAATREAPLRDIARRSCAASRPRPTRRRWRAPSASTAWSPRRSSTRTGGCSACITVDDVVDVIEEEAEEDILQARRRRPRPTSSPRPGRPACAACPGSSSISRPPSWPRSSSTSSRARSPGWWRWPC